MAMFGELIVGRPMTEAKRRILVTACIFVATWIGCVSFAKP